MSAEPRSPFAAMLAACAYAAETARGQTPPDAVKSARRWWNATSPADRLELLVRACRLAALALQSAVDTAGDLWRTGHPARPRIDALIGRFAEAIIEPFLFAQDRPLTDLPALQRQLGDLCQLLSSPGYLEGRITPTDMEEEFPEQASLAISQETLHDTGAELTTALLQPIQDQHYFPQAVTLFTGINQLLAATTCYVLLRLKLSVSEAADPAAWPPELHACCTGVHLIFAPCWDLILSLDPGQPCAATAESSASNRRTVISSRHPDLAFQLQDDLTAIFKWAARDGLGSVLHNIWQKMIDELAGCPLGADDQTQKFNLTISSVIPWYEVAAHLFDLNFKIDNTSSGATAPISHGLGSQNDHVVIDLLPDALLSDTAPQPIPTAVAITSQAASQASSAPVTTAPDIALRPVPAPVPSAPQSSLVGVGADQADRQRNQERNKIIKNLRNRVKQLLGQLETLLNALHGLSDGWEPACVLHTDARVQHRAFHYLAQDRKTIERLYKEMNKLRKYYREQLNVTSSYSYDLQKYRLIQAQDALRKELEPAVLRGELQGDAVAVFALAGRHDLVVQCGEMWLQYEDHLWAAHNLALAYLDWGEECACSYQREDAVRRWWDAVMHWSLLFDLDHPHVVQHWRQWAPDESRQTLAVMSDNELASVVKDVRERVFGLLERPPWMAFGLEKQREAHWLYDCVLNLFRIPPGDYQLLASASIQSAQTEQWPLHDVWYLIEGLMLMAEQQPDSRLDLLMEWEDWEQERLQRGWHLFLQAEYILNHLKRRHFTDLLFAPPDRKTVRLCRKLTVFWGKGFNSEELQTLCFDLEIDHETLRRETKGSLC